MTPAKKKQPSPDNPPTPQITPLASQRPSPAGMPQDSSIVGSLATLEASIQAFTGSRYAIPVSSVAAGLFLCTQAAEIGQGDLVITTPLASATSTSLLLQLGAVPVFVDVEPRSGNIDPHLVFAAAQDIMLGGKNARAWLPPMGASPEAKLKAILPVDTFGQPANLELILNTAWKYKIKVIEDASSALGASYQGHPAGSLGDYGVLGFSAHPALTDSLIGMVITDELAAASLMRSLCKQSHFPGLVLSGQVQPSADYHPGIDSARQALVQMQNIGELIAKSQQVTEWYDQRLAGLPGVELSSVPGHSTRVNWSAYIIRLAPAINRDVITDKLAARGMPALSSISLLHLHPSAVDHYGYRDGTFPVAEDLGRRMLALPFSCQMNEAQVEQVCQALRQLIS
jgi:perosamine synthetase